VAQKLREQGFNAFVIAGGLREWAKAGLPLEQVPETDVVLLPVFS
jgi:rhodanese-related sulfurtransferase